MKVLKRLFIFILIVVLLAGAGFGGFKAYQKFVAKKMPAGSVTSSYADGVLTLEGTGAMPGFSSKEKDREWDQYKDDIKKVIIGDGITSVGKNAFMNYENIETVELGSDIQLIDRNAFNSCKSLTSINLPVSVTEIGESAFWNCDKLSMISYAGSRDDWANITIADNNIVLSESRVSFAGEEEEVAPEEVEQTQSSDTVCVYRLLNEGSGEHFYTCFTDERDSLVASGWQYQGIVWKSPAKSSIPVYRLTFDSSHLYLMDQAKVDQLAAEGWKVECVCWYSDENQTVPVYSLYFPTGARYYTKDAAEKDSLVTEGWQDCGIAWYACE